MKLTSPQVQIADPFRPLPEYCLDPLEVVAIGLLLGEIKWAAAQMKAQARGLREYAIVGDASIRVQFRPPAEMRPPEAWLREFVKAKHMHRARAWFAEKDGEDVGKTGRAIVRERYQ